MTTRMLIDARHREETRVAVVKGNRIEEFDFESAERKQLKGNIYLAKVTRVEPSLQAAFVDYGGNRHGFLAFSEIHPDYYQIPREDREALLREEAEAAAEEAALRAEQEAREELEGDAAYDDGDEGDDGHEADRDDDQEDGEGDDAEPSAAEDGGSRRRGRKRRGRGSGGSEETVDDLRERRMNLRRRYKIQDVIKRRQVLLVQVVKEERGNKGAALTTYLSLAGRYCVLMPNTSHGGGISRKISNAADRKRLKSIMADLKLPPSMGCIVRTAGLQRTKVEIKRDFDYLARLWDEIREKTLASTAPALIHGDSDLIKRAVRDIYNKDIDEVIVEGEDGYRQAKDFMKLLMPSHARRVKHYSDPVPLFQRAHVEDQLAAMYNPVVQLKSGGYLVINPTEALVSIDINSGRSTREHNIEQTATATNLEAAQEIARQLRLRDMAGLVVIDFIDMDNNSNVRKVEKAMKEALKNDRARIQVGRISSFGLMEMSRQRLRTGVLEASTRQCPHCEGTGLVRTASSAGLSALRLLEEEAARGRGSELTLRASMEAAFYVLNRKRAELAEIEDRYGVRIAVAPDGEQEGARMSVDVSGPPPMHAPKFAAPIEDFDDSPEEYEDEIDEIEDGEQDEEDSGDRGNRREARGDEREDRDGSGRKRRRRRGRRGRNKREGGEQTEDRADSDDGAADSDAAEEGRDDGDAVEAIGSEADGDVPRGDGKKRRGRRGRRGGRRNGEGRSEDRIAGAPEDGASDDANGDDTDVSAEAPANALADEAAAEAAPKGRRRPRARKAAEAEAVTAEAVAVVEVAPEAPAADAKPKRTRKAKAEAVTEVPEAPEAPAEAAAKPRRKATRKKAEADAPAETPAIGGGAGTMEADSDAMATTASNGSDADAGNEAQTPRRGWWQRTFG